jgi:small subunit ribosomal protein S15
MLTKSDKQKIIEKFGKNPSDSGSSKVQIALLTERINYLTEHLAKNPKDFSTRRTLSILVSRRKSLLSYFKRKNKEEYLKLIEQLQIKDKE